MINSYIYLYYRICQFYGWSSRSGGLFAFFVSINVSFIFNILYRLFRAFGNYYPEPMILTLFLADVLFMALASIVVFPILIYVKKGAIGKKMDNFKIESAEERKKM